VALQEVISAAITKGSDLIPSRNQTRDPLDKYTKALMPTIQDSHPAALYNHIDLDTISKWLNLPRGKLLATPFDTEVTFIKLHENIRNRILAAVAEITASKSVGVVSPAPSEEALRTKRYPSSFLVYNLSETHRQILLKRKVWSSTNITFRLSPLEPANPDFLFAITGIAILDDESIKTAVKNTWNDHTTTTYLESIALKTSDAEIDRENIRLMFHNFLDSMWITSLEIRTTGNALEPYFNIYAKGNLIRGTNTWSDLRRHLADCTYSDPTQGQGATTLTPFHCAACHAVDHPRGMCPFPSVEGWNGPKWRPTQTQKKGGRARNSLPRGG
jgi:hypothetical protein